METTKPIDEDLPKPISEDKVETDIGEELQHLRGDLWKTQGEVTTLREMIHEMLLDIERIRAVIGQPTVPPFLTCKKCGRIVRSTKRKCGICGEQN